MEVTRQPQEGGWRVEILEGERSLSRCLVVDVQVRVGRAVLRVGGIGGVGTLPEWRGKGLSRRAMESAVELMQRERYDLSLLHGIQDFYHRFGYVTCMPEHEFSMDLRDAERAPRGARLRRMREGDRQAVVRIYSRDNALRTGSAVRPAKGWGGFPRGTWWTYRALPYVVVDARGAVQGYVVCNDVQDVCRASEVGGEGEEVFAAILSHLAQRALRLRRETVWANVPADHPFAVYCRRFGLRQHSLYPREAQFMGRVIDLETCLHALLPELAWRWGLAERGESVPLATDVGRATLAWHRGALRLAEGAGRSAVRLTQQELTQLVLGYTRPRDLPAAVRRGWSAPRAALLERLFPLQEAQLWWADRF